MKIEEFKTLSKQQQDAEVVNHGIFITSYTEEYNSCDIYKIFNFYVKYCFDLTMNSKPAVIVVISMDEFHLEENKLLRFSSN